MENEKIFEFMEKMYADLKSGQERLETKVTSIETEVKKNSIILETIEKKLDIVAEVQTAHKEQSIRAFEKTDSIIYEGTDLLETALKSTTRDIKIVKETIDVIKDMTGRHEVDINIIKRRPV